MDWAKAITLIARIHQRDLWPGFVICNLRGEAIVGEMRRDEERERW